MLNEILLFLEFVLGTYQPITYIDYIVDPATNSLQQIERIPDGPGAWDFGYIFSFILLFFTFYVLYKAYAFIASRFFGIKKRKIF